ncbi:MAG: DUF4153 domain-containing protein [Peptostreptococcaceae bacterium]|nr:DUF4153 domain-containing protein [Peptostreptococcaceae bacterium]
MNAFTKSIMRIYKGSIEAFQTFPASIASALAFAIVTMVRIQLDWPEQEAYNFLFNCLHWAFALGAIFGLASITFAQSRSNNAKSFKTANLLGLLVVAGAFATLYLFGAGDAATETTRFLRVSEIASVRVLAALIVSFLAFIVLAGFPKEESDFAQSFFMTHKAFFIAAIYGIVIMGGASGVAGAIQALLYNDMSEKVYMYIATIAGFLAFTIFVGYFPDFRKGKTDEHRNIAQKQPRFVEILFEFIMVPIIIAMTAVLIAWSGRTIITGDWPPFEELSSIATAYAFGGIWLHVMVTHGKSGLTKFYRKVYPIAAIVILAFEAWAIMDQLGRFGLKTIEYYFILTWIVAASASVFLLLMKGKAHRAIVFVICAVIIVSVLPVAGYNVLPVNMQANRLEGLLENEGMFKEGQIVPANDEPKQSVMESITDSVIFIASADDADLPGWFDERLAEKNVFEEKLGFKQIWPENDNYYSGKGTYMGTSLFLTREPIDIEDYKWAFNDISLYDGEEESVSLNGERGVYRFYWRMGRDSEIPSLEITLDGATIINEDMNDYLDRILEEYPIGSREKQETPLKDMSMSIETPEAEVLLVFRHVEANVDPQDDIINYWIDLDAVYFNEK